MILYYNIESIGLILMLLEAIFLSNQARQDLQTIWAVRKEISVIEESNCNEF